VLDWNDIQILTSFHDEVYQHDSKSYSLMNGMKEGLLLVFSIKNIHVSAYISKVNKVCKVHPH